ncbi:MAG: Gfo/Idh/MocA family oxidoreductase [Planctomycetaceae bacterium]
MTNSTRREFLQQSAGGVSLAAGLAALGSVHTFGAEKPAKLALGIIGCGGMMTGHVTRLVTRKDEVEIAWLCDVDQSQIDKMTAIVDGTQSAPPKRTTRYEDVIEDKRVDACIIATPHHWHAPIALRAMHSGKDVYIEKPISHVFAEGPVIIAAAKKYGRVVQQGSQMRSSPVTLQAEKLLKSGIIGEIKVARAWTAETREEIPAVPDSATPQGVDYDRWLGPAPEHAFNQLRFHEHWRLYRDYGNGEIGDDGIHDLDMATWGLGVDTLPKQITARGGRMMLPNHYSEYPDNMNVAFEYPDGRLLIYENYPFTAYGLHGYDNGNVFYGTEGYMIFSRRGSFSVFLGPKGKPGPTEDKAIRTQRGYPEHMTDFLTAVRNRTATRANPEVAHRSCALVHLGNIAYLCGGQVNFDPKTERFVGNESANHLLNKEYREPYGLPNVV